MINQSNSEMLGFEVLMGVPYEQAIDLVTAALKVEGFGVLTRIDVRTTLKEKLNQDFRPYVILGACNPPLAHRALSANSWVGLMLPCNVTVESTGDRKSLVRIINPQSMLTFGDLSIDPVLSDVALEAYTKLRRVALILAE
jgi:uncharacterized protein (DUF302 family)